MGFLLRDSRALNWISCIYAHMQWLNGGTQILFHKIILIISPFFTGPGAQLLRFAYLSFCLCFVSFYSPLFKFFSGFFAEVYACLRVGYVCAHLCSENIIAKLWYSLLFFITQYKGFCLHTHISSSKISLSAIAVPLKYMDIKTTSVEPAYINALA